LPPSPRPQRTHAPLPLAAVRARLLPRRRRVDLRTAGTAALAAIAAGHCASAPGAAPGRRCPGVQSGRGTRRLGIAEHGSRGRDDDMPFLVDSLAMVLNGSGLSIHTMTHPVLGVRRDRSGGCRGGGRAGRRYAESGSNVEVDRIADDSGLESLRRRIETTLDDVRVAVEDCHGCSSRHARAAALSDGPGHFAGRGRRGSGVRRVADRQPLHLPGTGVPPERGATVDRLWRCRARPRPAAHGAGRHGRRHRAAARGAGTRARASALVVTKANSVSTVHRATYLDYVSAKTFDARGA